VHARALASVNVVLFCTLAVAPGHSVTATEFTELEHAMLLMETLHHSGSPLRNDVDGHDGMHSLTIRHRK
jgi:hypothetical protein